MRDEILKVLEMNKAGKIDDDQAAELIAAMKGKDDPQPAGTPPEFNLNNLGEMISGLVNNALSKNISIGGGKIKIRTSSGDDNNVNSSKVEQPRGDDYEFTDNQINLSTVSGLEFSHSANFSDNNIQASTIKNLTMSHGEFTDSQVNGSSLEDVIIDASEWVDQSINGCKFQKVSLNNNSCLSDLQWHGSHLKNVTLDSVELSDLKFHGINANQLTMAKCEWSDMAIMGCQFNDCEFEKVNFSDGKLEGIRFVNCKIKNVEFSDFALAKVDFSGATIDGNGEMETFLRRARG